MARLGAEDAYGLAVAEGYIDVEMQNFFASEACLEFAAFEFFRSSDECRSPKSAAYHWRRMNSDDKGYWLDQVDDDQVLKVVFRQWELRTGMLSDLLFDAVFPKTTTLPSDSDASDEEFGKQIKLGSKMPPVPPCAEEAEEERQRPPEA